MKKITQTLIVLSGCILMCALSSFIVFPSEYVDLDENDALQIAIRQFEGCDYDYYLVEHPNASSQYMFFVDAMPGMDWEHECYGVYVNKRIGWPESSYVPQVVSSMAPPAWPMKSVKLADRQSVGLTEVPYVPKRLDSEWNQGVAQRTWAVIISGGINCNQNFERYWNNCAYIYRTLRNRYKIPKAHIDVIMADGTDPGKDQFVEVRNSEGKVISTYYKSSPLDLDDDGVADIQYAATRANIAGCLRDLQTKAKRGDHVFLFVTDHGGSTDTDNGTSFIGLWDGQRLFDYELAEWIEPLLENGITLSCVLGQCYAGGFVDDLSKNGCVVAAASLKNETTLGKNGVSMFLAYWTDACNDPWFKDDPDNPRETIDLNDDDYITMDEAFMYAYKRYFGDDPHRKQYLYKSTHPFLGAQLAFDNLPAEVDLMIKDNSDDMGDQPNISTSIFYDSPSIWVRNEDDDKLEHENPYFAIDHDGCWVYVRVHNRGRFDYLGGQYLHVYWAKASLTFSSRTWLGEETYNNYTTGGLIGSVPINSIKAGESRIVKMRWEMPPLPTDGDDRQHFCLLAKVMTNEFDDGGLSSNDFFSPQNSRRQAQKNVSIISKLELADVYSVFVRNPDVDDDAGEGDDSNDFTLELVPHTIFDSGLFKIAKVEAELAPAVYNAWVKGGKTSRNVTINFASPRKLYFNSANSSIGNLNFVGREFDKLKLKFVFTGNTSSLQFGRKYRVDLVQKDKNGKILGGEAFIVEPPFNQLIFPELDISANSGNEVALSVIDQENLDVNWMNGIGDIIENNPLVIVKPTVSDHIFKVSALNDDGEIAFKTISLGGFVGIESISPESTVGDELTVTMRAPTAVGDKLIIAGVSESGDRIDCELEADSKSISIDTSSLRPGLYVISYISSNDVVDTKKFTKK